MIEKSPTLARLIRHLQQVPYLASKNLYRVLGYILTMEQEKADQLCSAILEAKKNIVLCSTCFCWQDRTIPCTYCDPRRDQAIICVVETWHELIAVEKTAGYKGAYHVLGGALSPLDGIEPSDLRINELVARVNDSQSVIKEIILATNQTPEGEATAAYIANRLKTTGIIISCLARGVPVGASLEFMDKVTVYKALSDRRPF